MSSSINKNTFNDNRNIEAILENEPFDNNYFIVPPSLTNLHPYVLVGKLQTYYPSSKQVHSEGVAFLIGNDIILTSAHNIYNGINDPSLIEFTPLMNGAIKLMSPIKVIHYEIMDEFKERKKLGIIDNILIYDFAIGFLEKKLGSEIIEKLNINTKTETKFKFFDIGNKQLFYYFIQLKNEMLNLNYKFCDGNMCEKIAMISYIYYKKEYLQNEHFRYKTSILRSLSNHNIHEETHQNDYYIFMHELKEKKRNAHNIKLLNNNIMYLETNSFLLTESRGTLCNTIGMNKNKKGKSSDNLKEDIRESEFSLDDRPTRDTMSYYRTSFYKNKLSNVNFNSDKELYEMDYLITTYVGQSGSPIFLRKKNNDYILIGIHSRSSGTFPLQSKEPNTYQSNYITNSGMSLYNMGLALTSSIQSIIYKMISKNAMFNFNEVQLPKQFLMNDRDSCYCIVSIYHNNNFMFNGLFHKTVKCKNIVNIISKDYLGISPEYIRLLYRGNKCICYYDYESIICLNELQCNDIKIHLEVEVIEDKLSDDFSKKIISKIKETGKKIVKGNKKLFVNLIVMTIQSELNVIKGNNIFLYAKLYHLIQNKVIKEYIEELK